MRIAIRKRTQHRHNNRRKTRRRQRTRRLNKKRRSQNVSRLQRKLLAPQHKIGGVHKLCDEQFNYRFYPPNVDAEIMNELLKNNWQNVQIFYRKDPIDTNWQNSHLRIKLKEDPELYKAVKESRQTCNVVQSTYFSQLKKDLKTLANTVPITETASSLIRWDTLSELSFMQPSELQALHAQQSAKPFCIYHNTVDFIVVCFPDTFTSMLPVDTMCKSYDKASPTTPVSNEKANAYQFVPDTTNVPFRIITHRCYVLGRLDKEHVYSMRELTIAQAEQLQGFDTMYRTYLCEQYGLNGHGFENYFHGTIEHTCHRDQALTINYEFQHPESVYVKQPWVHYNLHGLRQTLAMILSKRGQVGAEDTTQPLMDITYESFVCLPLYNTHYKAHIESLPQYQLALLSQRPRVNARVFQNVVHKLLDCLKFHKLINHCLQTEPHTSIHPYTHYGIVDRPAHPLFNSFVQFANNDSQNRFIDIMQKMASTHLSNRNAFLSELKSLLCAIYLRLLYDVKKTWSVTPHEKLITPEHIFDSKHWQSTNSTVMLANQKDIEYCKQLDITFELWLDFDYWMYVVRNLQENNTKATLAHRSSRSRFSRRNSSNHLPVVKVFKNECVISSSCLQNLQVMRMDRSFDVYRTMLLHDTVSQNNYTAKCFFTFSDDSKLLSNLRSATTQPFGFIPSSDNAGCLQCVIRMESSTDCKTQLEKSLQYITQPIPEQTLQEKYMHYSSFLINLFNGTESTYLEIFNETLTNKKQLHKLCEILSCTEDRRFLFYQPLSCMNLLRDYLQCKTRDVSYQRLVAWEIPSMLQNLFVRDMSGNIVHITLLQKMYPHIRLTTTTLPALTTKSTKDTEYRFPMEMINDQNRKDENHKALQYLLLRSQHIAHLLQMHTNHASFTFHYYDTDADTSKVHLHIYGVNTLPEYAQNVKGCLFETYRHGKTQQLQQVISVLSNQMMLPFYFFSKSKS